MPERVSRRGLVVTEDKRSDLFGYDGKLNLLPYDGEVNYFGCVLDAEHSQAYLQYLSENISWKNDQLIIYGKHITSRRKTAWYGDKNYAYTYSNTTKYALPWTKELLELKAIVEKYSQVTFNSCLLNLYTGGEEGMSWHSDDEKSLGKNTSIASLSFGEARRFLLKHKVSADKVSLVLESGSLLVMKGETQSHWLHSLPKTAKKIRPRINLTFRTIVDHKD